MDSIRIIIVDDDRNVHHAVQVLLRTDPSIRLVGQAYEGAETTRLYQAARPDVVLLDVEMPDLSGPQAAVELLASFPEARVLVISSYQDHESIRQMMEAGARGYVVKDALTRDLLPAIRATLQGQTVLSSAVRESLFGGEPVPHNLTTRELEVLRLLAQGLTNPAIAAELDISVPTVRFHTANILDKLTVTTRSEALVLAARRGLI
jgi:NarL family two-component system response regulator LiaR